VTKTPLKLFLNFTHSAFWLYCTEAWDISCKCKW
jgi:hypothetical protein